METSKKLAKFKDCLTLQKNRLGDSFVELPVKDYEELSLINIGLLVAIRLIIENRENVEDQCEVTNSIRILFQLTDALNLHEDCMGLTELLKENT